MSYQNMGLPPSDKERIDNICNKNIGDVTLDDISNLRSLWGLATSKGDSYIYMSIEYVLQNLSQNKKLSDFLKAKADSALKSIYSEKKIKGAI